MPEYDAFGREVGEDTLAEAGWRRAGEEGPAPRPVAAPEPEDAPAPDAPFGAPASLTAADGRVAGASPVAPASVLDAAMTVRREFRLLRWLVRLVVVAVIAFTALQAVNAGTDDVRDALDDFRGAVQDVPTAAVPEGGDGGGAAGEAGPSLLTRKGMAAGLRHLRRDAPGRLRSLRVEAARIDVSLGLRGGRIRSAQVARGAEAARILSTSPGGFGNTGLFGYADVRPAAVERLIRSANRRLGRRTKDVDYLVLMSFGEDLVWGVYYRNGAIAQGDARGRFLRKVG